MKSYSVFDILGPIMIGPSSSHTAGAARLGKVARMIAGENIKKVIFYLHGSFAKTYRGHGTDRALVGGILGFDTDDPRIRNSFEIAKKEGVEFEFIEADLGDVHPNTVKMKIEMKDGNIQEVMGSSIGGGSIVITKIDGLDLEFTGNYPTLITKHKDRPGIIAEVSNILKDYNVNIAFMRVFRQNRGDLASMILETDEVIPKEAIERVKNIKDIYVVKVLDSIK